MTIDHARLRVLEKLRNAFVSEEFSAEECRALLDEVEALRAENERVRAANVDCVAHFDDVKAERDTFAALLRRAHEVIWSMDVLPEFTDEIDAALGRKDG